MLTYISNSAHYKEVLSRVQTVKYMLWVGTADIKVICCLCCRFLCIRKNKNNHYLDFLYFWFLP